MFLIVMLDLVRKKSMKKSLQIKYNEIVRKQSQKYSKNVEKWSQTT